MHFMLCHGLHHVAMHAWHRAEYPLCAGLLGDHGCETLAAESHRSLLCHLCDEAMDREPLRVLLTRRMDWAENVRKEMRDAAVQDKGRIKASLSGIFDDLLTL